MIDLRFPLVVVALLAVFLFPLTYTLVLTVAAAVFFPPVALMVGGLLDVLYYHGEGLPYYTGAGILLTIFFAFVQQFVKARIMT